MNIKFLIFNTVILMTSCASYKYNGTSTRVKNNSVFINSDNLSEFEIQLKGDKRIEKLSNGSTQIILNTLKKEDLDITLSNAIYDPIYLKLNRTVRPLALTKDIALGIFTLGVPIIVDVFNHQFYRVSPKTKNFKVHFEFKQSYMEDEFKEISKSKNPTDYQNWINKYPKSNIFQNVINHKDSLELSIALSKESEVAVDEFIASHQNSNYLQDAQKIKTDMVAAREMFDASKTTNKVSAYEAFLDKYPRSLHNTDAHRKLVFAAEKEALNSEIIALMQQYILKYLDINQAYLSKKELEEKKLAISKAIDIQLVKDNIKKDPKNFYNDYSKLWQAYSKLKNEIPSGYLISMEQTYSYQNKICDMIFTKLKESSNLEKQNQLVEKSKLDFPNLDLSDDNKNFLITVLENASNSSGNLKLFKVGFMPYYFNNMSERDELIGRNIYNYKSKDYEALKNITYEEVGFLNGGLNGTIKCFINNDLDVAFNIANGKPKEISYYQNGKLVKTISYLTSEKFYEYEYENGINLTLKELDSKISEGSSYLKAGNYDQAISIFENALKNNFPSNLAQNTSLQKNLSNAKNQKSAFLKKQDEIRIAEQKKKEADEAERSKPIVLDDYYDLWDNPSQYIGRNVAMAVYHNTSSDDYVIYQREQGKTVKGSVKNSWFKNTQYHINERDLPTDYYYMNWKHFTEITTGKTITVNIPDKFFDNDLIPHDTGQSGYVITVNVYPMRESRGAGQKGKYNDNGGSERDITYELLDIKRLKR